MLGSGDRHGSKGVGRGAGVELHKAAWRRSRALVLDKMCWTDRTGQTLLPEIWEGAEYTGVGCCLTTIYFWFSGLLLISTSSFPLPPFISSLFCVLLGVSRPPAILVCLSGMNGSTLWSSPLPEEARDITCLDLMPGSVAGTICLVTGMHKMLSAFNATSGEDHLPQKISAPVSHGLGLEQSGGGGPSTLTWWKIWFTALESGYFREITERVGIGWVLDPQFSLNRNYLEAFGF